MLYFWGIKKENSIRKTNNNKKNLNRIYYLGSGLPGCFCLCSHSSLELHRELHILNFYTLHLYSPVIGGIIQSTLLGGKKASESRSAPAQRATLTVH
jgi:hypothetical protein